MTGYKTPYRNTKKLQPQGLEPGDGEHLNHTDPAPTSKAARHHIWWQLKPYGTTWHHKPPDASPERSVRTEPGATGAETDRQQRQNTNCRSHKRQSHQLLSPLLLAGLDRLTAVQGKLTDAPFYPIQVTNATNWGHLCWQRPPFILRTWEPASGAHTKQQPL